MSTLLLISLLSKLLLISLLLTVGYFIVVSPQLLIPCWYYCWLCCQRGMRRSSRHSPPARHIASPLGPRSRAVRTRACPPARSTYSMCRAGGTDVRLKCGRWAQSATIPQGRSTVLLCVRSRPTEVRVHSPNRSKPPQQAWVNSAHTWSPLRSLLLRLSRTLISWEYVWFDGFISVVYIVLN